MTFHASSFYSDPAWCEAQYNPRGAVPNATDIYARWPLDSARLRAELPHEADIRYGDHAREVMDVFHAADPRGALVFIHGGYWRGFSKDDFSFLAQALVQEGISVALPNYPLCPEVSVADIAQSCRRAVAKLWRDVLSPAERARLVVSGHSAGGYLTAALFATDWADYALPLTPFCGGLSISGVFELEPLVNTSMNSAIGLDVARARAWSLPKACPHVAAPLLLTVGGLESPEFHRQSAELATAWPEICHAPVSIPGRHHFDVVEELGRAGTPLFVEAMGLFA
ncbi:arylformamidase [Rhizobiales bacterium GAS113]|nr:arylformamidase [Rhizobiales bacterium GAS113]